MSAKSAKLDKSGIILPLAVGAILVIAFVMFLYKGKISKVAEKLPAIETVEDLDKVLMELDSEKPESMDSDVKGVASDASTL